MFDRPLQRRRAASVASCISETVCCRGRVRQPASCPAAVSTHAGHKRCTPPCQALPSSNTEQAVLEATGSAGHLGYRAPPRMPLSMLRRPLASWLDSRRPSAPASWLDIRRMMPCMLQMVVHSCCACNSVATAHRNACPAGDGTAYRGRLTASLGIARSGSQPVCTTGRHAAGTSADRWLLRREPSPSCDDHRCMVSALVVCMDSPAVVDSTRVRRCSSVRS